MSDFDKEFKRNRRMIKVAGTGIGCLAISIILTVIVVIVLTVGFVFKQVVPAVKEDGIKGVATSIWEGSSDATNTVVNLPTEE